MTPIAWPVDDGSVSYALLQSRAVHRAHPVVEEKSGVSVLGEAARMSSTEPSVDELTELGDPKGGIRWK